jgi:GMP synthase (glutamine-hydrolysing)
MSRRAPKILLLQIRDQPKVRAEEHASFARYAGLTPAQLSLHNVFDAPKFGPSIVEGYDALFVGGASEASVLEPQLYTFVPACIELLRDCMARRFPVFASCFGYQLAVSALGGKLVRDTENFEMGTIPITLTSAAASDPLLCDVPTGFLAVSVHQERTSKAPPGTESLAHTPLCHHAFRVNGCPFWAFQFHPEVDRQTMVERLTVFKSKYTRGEDHLAGVLSRTAETPESNRLPQKFVERVLLGRV